MERRSRHTPGDPPPAARTTARDTVLACVWVPHQTPVPLIADLRYDSTDPYAVCLVLYPGDAEAVQWFFGRSLLADGVFRRVGNGDVVVRPVRVRGTEFVQVTLRAPAGSIDLHMPSRAVLSFVKKTEAMVPPGTEDRHLDLDDLVRRLS